MRGILLSLAIACSFGVAEAQDACSALTAGESQALQAINEARARSGLLPLVVDCRLMTASRAHARRLAKSLAIYHSPANAAENVAGGHPHARAAVDAWLASPGHRANILGRGHRRVGVAGFIGTDGRAYWVSQFLP
jgi:uncharacterized protein YkwD